MAVLFKKPEISKVLKPINPPPSLAEFINTEKEYVGKLEAIFKMYLQPTEQYKYLPLMITQEDVFTIISNIVIIMKIHTTFLKNLTALSEKPPAEQLVGALFVEFEPNLKRYRNYVNSIENGLRSLCLRIITSDNIDTFLKKAENMEISKNGVTLPSFLNIPFKRIEYYQDYLLSLANASSHDKPDYNNLMNALRAVDEIHEVIENQKEGSIPFIKILDILKENPLTWTESFTYQEIELFVAMLEYRNSKDKEEVDNKFDRKKKLIHTIIEKKTTA